MGIIFNLVNDKCEITPEDILFGVFMEWCYITPVILHTAIKFILLMVELKNMTLIGECISHVLPHWTVFCNFFEQCQDTIGKWKPQKIPPIKGWGVFVHNTFCTRILGKYYLIEEKM